MVMFTMIEILTIFSAVSTENLQLFSIFSLLLI